jgi:tetratricopeptide (TPR) repeat protein
VEDGLATLLADGERAAFHGAPMDAVASLEQAFEQAATDGRPDVATAAAWLLGVSLGAAGRFGSALEVLEPLAAQDGADIPERRLFAALACSTAAAVHRQLGQHAVARGLDQRGLAMAEGAAEAAFDAELGLAADAVGLGEAVVAAEFLARARVRAEARQDWWRQGVRLAWVQAEVALLAGDAEAAVEAVTPAVHRAEVAGAPRHVAKSLLFLGVAQIQADRIDEAASTLRRAATLAESLGALPLLWPSRAVLGALLEETAPAESARCLAAARSAVIAIADDLPERLRPVWLDREDVSALLGG